MGRLGSIDSISYDNVWCYLTGALASDGVVEGAVEEAGVRMVLLGATPCRAHRILCLCPGCGHESIVGSFTNIKLP